MDAIDATLAAGAGKPAGALLGELRAQAAGGGAMARLVACFPRVPGVDGLDPGRVLNARQLDQLLLQAVLARREAAAGLYAPGEAYPDTLVNALMDALHGSRGLLDDHGGWAPGAEGFLPMSYMTSSQ